MKTVYLLLLLVLDPHGQIAHIRGAHRLEERARGYPGVASGL